MCIFWRNKAVNLKYPYNIELNITGTLPFPAVFKLLPQAFHAIKTHDQRNSFIQHMSLLLKKLHFWKVNRFLRSITKL